MQYRTMKDGTEVSLLGFGCMRFPRSGGAIDAEASERLIMRALELGINYFDTAYLYPGSEEALGTILEKNGCRDRALIATKLPQYLVRKPEDLDRLFDEELRRLKTDYVDYYLMHMLPDADRWEKLCSLGIREWIAEKKASGAIRHIGFSFHGNADTFIKLADAYEWEFCQIQYNYLDENTQAGRRGLNHAAEIGLPVIIMEPLRGGRLVQYMPPAAKAIMEAYPEKRSAAEWAFRWLYDQAKVTCVLSGMSTMDMLEENARVAAETEPGCMTDDEQAMIASVRDAINASMKIGCTGCNYCMPCPKGVDIPGTFSCYNRIYSEGRFSALKDFIMTTGSVKDGADYRNCIECGKCTKHCPQSLDIPALLKVAGAELMPWYVRVARAAMRKFTV